ncbi:uncharacterized protein G2W53_024686 [Senna tora]|uniref:Uncharacterized protein n=1 Tax=Senna tora TaxID=362788 RepID=A0A834WH61_9FABA|nr:uncharacterized protein G2W53_024686 [Senna tora]
MATNIGGSMTMRKTQANIEALWDISLLRFKET